MRLNPWKRTHTASLGGAVIPLHAEPAPDNPRLTLLFEQGKNEPSWVQIRDGSIRRCGVEEDGEHGVLVEYAERLTA